MLRRPVAISLIAFYLIVVGLWSAAVAPVALAAGGLAVVLGSIPTPVLALAAVAIAVRLKHRRPAPTATA